MRVAVVGGGIAELRTGYVLSRAHGVQLFERDARRRSREGRSSTTASRSIRASWRTTNETEAPALGYDRRFERTLDFYLAFCEAAFRTHALRDVQVTLRCSSDG